MGTIFRSARRLLRIAIPLSVIASLLVVPALPTRAQPDVTLSGTVKDNLGSPLAAAEVQVINPATLDVIASTTTDASGAYSLTIPEGTYDIKAIPPAGSGFHPSVFLSFVLSVDAVLNFVLLPAAAPVTLSGKVLDTLGNGIPNQTVYLYGADLRHTAVTNASGSYSFEVAAGDYRLELRRQPVLGGGFDVNAPTIMELDSASFSLTQNTVMDITLPVKKVTVHVQGPAGTSVSGVWLETSGLTNPDLNLGSISGGGYNRYHSSSPTNTAGDVILWLFPTVPGQYYAFTVTAPAGSPLGVFRVHNVAIASDQTVVIVLQFTAPIVSVISPDQDTVIDQPPSVTALVSASDDIGVTGVTVTVYLVPVSGDPVDVGSGSASLIDGIAQSGTWQANIALTALPGSGEALKFVATAADGTASTDSNPVIVDNDGIAAIIDTNPAVFSDYFSDMFLGGTTFGNIDNRAGHTVLIEELPAPAGVKVSISGSGGPAKIDANGTGNSQERIIFSAEGQIAHISGVPTFGSPPPATKVKAIAGVSTANKIKVRKPPTGQITAQAELTVPGDEATVGSACVASPQNTAPIVVRVVKLIGEGDNEVETSIGSGSLAVGQAIEISFPPEKTIRFSNPGGTDIKFTMSGIEMSLGVGQGITILPGDANGDGALNALDITKVERVIARLDAPTLGADADLDGGTGATDITKTERIIAELD